MLEPLGPHIPNTPRVMASFAKDRKRKALSDLRDLAEEVGLPVNRGRADLSLAAFTAAHAEVLAAFAVR